MSYKKNNVTTPNPRTARVSGGMTAGSTGAVGALTGTGWSIARTAAGKYTLTLLTYYPTLISFTGGVMTASADGDAVLNFGAFSASAKTLIIKTVLNGVVADLSSADRLFFDLEFASSTV